MFASRNPSAGPIRSAPVAGCRVPRFPPESGHHGQLPPAPLQRSALPGVAQWRRRVSTTGDRMNDEKIQVRITSSGQMLDVVVFEKRLDVIQVVLGEGVHSVRCDLTPTRNGLAYVGNARGREIVYERTREQVKADLARAAGFRDFKR